MMDLSYRATGRSDMLKNRSKRCCCRYCGGQLEVKSIIFSDFIEARLELYCPLCDRIEFGVEPEIYASALYFAEAMDYTAYPELAANESTKRMTVARLCEIMTWQDRHLGILNDEGFMVGVRVSERILGEGVLFSDTDLS